VPLPIASEQPVSRSTASGSSFSVVQPTAYWRGQARSRWRNRQQTQVAPFDVRHRVEEQVVDTRRGGYLPEKRLRILTDIPQ
jgi:hypothetical protein